MFQITNGGIYTRHPSIFLMNRNQGFDKYVLLVIKCTASLVINEKHYSIQPHQALFIAPHTPYSYFNPNGTYIDDWMHFTCSPEDMKFLNPSIFHIPFSVRNPSLIEMYFQQLLYENTYTPENLRASHIDRLFRLMAEHLMFDFENTAKCTYSPYLFPMQKLRLEMLAAPQNAGNAKEAASQIGISLSYFQHLYTEFFNISYQKDLIQMKISYAKELLHTTKMTIEDISYYCGYTNQVHFFRQFQNITGVTPKQYREMQ